MGVFKDDIYITEPDDGLCAGPSLEGVSFYFAHKKVCQS